MTKDSQDALARAYAMLTSLRKNLDKMTYSVIPEKYVDEFHDVLDKLENIGIETADFRIADSLVKPRIPGGTEKHVERLFILTKIEAILGYFEIIISDKPKKMGFRREE